MSKLYFCGDCGTLIGRQDKEGSYCLNCGEAFEAVGTIEGEFEEHQAQRLLRINSIPHTPE